jgi:Fur family ferric uptake transcriptional regulator
VVSGGEEEQLRAAGLRVTAGRVAILSSLNRMPHADAESLYRDVQGVLSATSVQSVHNVLGALTVAGVIRRIEPAGSPARYERRIGDNHHHVVCTECGIIGDVDCAVGEAPCLTPSNAAGFTVHTAEVTFWGLCPECARTQASSPRFSSPTDTPIEPDQGAQ